MASARLLLVLAVSIGRPVSLFRFPRERQPGQGDYSVESTAEVMKLAGQAIYQGGVQAVLPAPDHSPTKGHQHAGSRSNPYDFQQVAPASSAGVQEEQTSMVQKAKGHVLWLANAYSTWLKTRSFNKRISLPTYFISLEEYMNAQDPELPQDEENDGDDKIVRAQWRFRVLSRRLQEFRLLFQPKSPKVLEGIMHMCRQASRQPLPETMTKLQQSTAAVAWYMDVALTYQKAFDAEREEAHRWMICVLSNVEMDEDLKVVARSERDLRKLNFGKDRYAQMVTCRKLFLKELKINATPDEILKLCLPLLNVKFDTLFGSALVAKGNGQQVVFPAVDLVCVAKFLTLIVLLVGWKVIGAICWVGGAAAVAHAAVAGHAAGGAAVATGAAKAGAAVAAKAAVAKAGTAGAAAASHAGAAGGTAATTAAAHGGHGAAAVAVAEKPGVIEVLKVAPAWGFGIAFTTFMSPFLDLFEATLVIQDPILNNMIENFGRKDIKWRNLTATQRKMQEAMSKPITNPLEGTLTKERRQALLQAVSYFCSSQENEHKVASLCSSLEKNKKRDADYDRLPKPDKDKFKAYIQEFRKHEGTKFDSFVAMMMILPPKGDLLNEAFHRKYYDNSKTQALQGVSDLQNEKYHEYSKCQRWAARGLHRHMAGLYKAQQRSKGDAFVKWCRSFPAFDAVDTALASIEDSASKFMSVFQLRRQEVCEDDSGSESDGAESDGSTSEESSSDEEDEVDEELCGFLFRMRNFPPWVDATH